MTEPIRLALFASGNGTNVQQISEYFNGRKDVEVACVVYNVRTAFVAQRAEKLGIEARYFSNEDFRNSQGVVDYLKEKQVDRIVLAGFLLLVPTNILSLYSEKIVNIHPALLPNYGGKGMYGHHVHQAVVANHEKETGITIHVVDEQYDHGKVLFQARCSVAASDTADDVAAKIHLLEKEFYPKVVDSWVTGCRMPVQES